MKMITIRIKQDTTGTICERIWYYRFPEFQEMYFKVNIINYL